MRFVWAVAAFVLAAVMIGAGIFALTGGALLVATLSRPRSLPLSGGGR